MAGTVIGKEGTMRAHPDPITTSRRSRRTKAAVKAIALAALGLGLVALAQAPIEVGRNALEATASRTAQPGRPTWAPTQGVTYFPAQFGAVAGSVDESPLPTF